MSFDWAYHYMYQSVTNKGDESYRVENRTWTLYENAVLLAAYYLKNHHTEGINISFIC